MKIWISKYALTAGITEHDCDVGVGCEYVYPGQPFFNWTGFKLGRDAHVTKEAAVSAAKAAREKKITSLRKQIAALEKKKFVVAG